MSRPHAAYRIHRRWLTLLAVAVVAAAGLLFLVVGVVARSRGELVPWPVPVAGALVVLLAVVAGLLTTRPRRPQPAVAVPGGVALPLRPGYAVLVAAAPVLLGAVAAVATWTDDRVWVRLMGLVILLGLVAVGGLWARGAPQARLVVGPDGLRLPHRSTGRQDWPWSAVAEVRLVHGFVPLLLVVPRDESQAPAFTRLYPQGWSFEAIAALVDHYRGDRRARAELTSPEAVDRFRC